MSCSPCKLRKRVSWCPPPDGILKFNVEGVARGKPKLAGIGGVLYNSEGKVLFMFSKNEGVKESNEEVLDIQEELLRLIFWSSFEEDLKVESDSSNAIH